MRWIIAAMILFPAALTPAATSRPASRPTTIPVNPMFLDARRLVHDGHIRDIAGKAKPKLLVQFDGLAAIDLDETVRLGTLREFSTYFGRVNEPDQGQIETLQWLITQPHLASALMMAVSSYDPPERVLEILRALRDDHREKMDEFASLAAAVCVVWDAPERFGQQEDPKIDPSEVSRIFGYFAQSADRLQFDPRRLPTGLLVFVVDLDLSEDELRWLAEQTGHHVNVPTAFSMVPYVESTPYTRNSKDPADPQAYLLPNMLHRGGGTDISSYVACQAARSAGIPAVMVRAADVGEGPVPWWVGYLQGGGAPAWDFVSARYREHIGWSAQIVDPQTNEISPEADVALLSGLLTTPPRDRLASMALVKSIDLLPPKQRVPLLRKALDLSPANRSAWYALADLAAAEKFDDDAMKPVEELLQKYLARKYPELATSLRLRMLKGRGAIEFDHGAKRAIDAVRAWPNLVAMVELAGVDRLRDEKRYPEAANALKGILLSQACSPAVAVAVMARMEDVLRKQNDVPQLAMIYHDVFNALPRPGMSKWGRTTVYYRIGARYAAALDEVNQGQEAQMVRTKIDNVVLSN